MNTVSGVNFANAKRVCKMMFEDFLYKLEKNDKECTYDVYLDKNVDRKIVSKLKKTYPNFRIFYTVTEQEK